MRWTEELQGIPALYTLYVPLLLGVFRSHNDLALE